METVKVRIAVAVDETGEWCSAGWSGYANDDDLMGSARNGVVDNFAREFWIEAEIPIPRPTTIPATVSPAEGE